MTRRDEHLAIQMLIGAQAKTRHDARLPNHELDNTGAEALWQLARDFVNIAGKDAALKIADTHQGYSDIAKIESTKVSHLRVASAIYEAVEVMDETRRAG